jgi:hypothetical protein
MKHAKIIFTILPISLIGIIIKLFNRGYDSWGYTIWFCVCGIISTMIVVPLMYCFISTKYKIVNGIVRGILGAYLIMFLTIVMLTLEYLFEDGIISHIFAMAGFAVFIPLVMTHQLLGFTFGVMVSFLLVDRFIMDPKYK